MTRASSTSSRTPRRRAQSLAASHYENFPIFTRLSPRRTREPLAVIYAYCRGVDDLGDEAPGDRLALLDDWEEDLHRAFAAREPRHWVMQALADLLTRIPLPKKPFLDLIEANRLDQRVSRWGTWKDLLGYCRRSADPVGRLVLRVWGYDDPALDRLSDRTCTALQLVNFWQDVARDLRDRNRIYLPREILAAHGVDEVDIVAGRATPAFRSALADVCGRARALFEGGLPLAEKVALSLRLDLLCFTEGGLAILDRIERADYDVLRARPSLRKADALALVWKAGRRLLGLRRGAGGAR